MRAAGRGAVVALLVAVCALISAGTAAATPSSFAVMFREDEPGVGDGGLIRLYTPRASRIKLTGNRSEVLVVGSKGTFESTFRFEFAAPRGKKLHKGVYLYAQRAAFRRTWHPGIDLSGAGHGCNRIAGSFEIKDIRFARGSVRRLWLVYEHHCELGRVADFGEIRVGEPPTRDPVLVAPATLRWPANDSGRNSTAVPASVRAIDAPVTIARVAIVGRNAGAFVIRADRCSGRRLTVGESCQISLRHEPQTPGTHLARLRIVDSRGRRREVSVQAFAFGGRTSATLTSDPGDYIGRGRPWWFTWANAELQGAGRPNLIGFGVVGNPEESFSAGFAPPPGRVMKPGTYPNARRWPFNEGHPGMDVSSRGSGCNYLEGAFTVHSVTWWLDGTLRSGSVTFEQHCEGHPAALRGTFEFRAGDKTPLPPWLRWRSV